MKIKGSGLLLLIVLVIMGCMATRFDNVWKDASYQKGPVKKILVIAIMPSPERVKMVEDEMAKQLVSRGVTAIAGYTELEGKTPSTDAVISVLGKLSVDAILVTKLSGREYKTDLGMPGNYGAFIDQWDRTSGVDWGPAPTVASVGVDPQQYAFMQTNLYDVETHKKIWSVLTETWIVGTDSRLTSSFVNTVLQKLADDRLIR